MSVIFLFFLSGFRMGGCPAAGFRKIGGIDECGQWAGTIREERR